MNYLPFVSWGMYGGITAKERANFFVSWGMMADLPNILANYFCLFMQYYRRLRA